MTKNVFPPLDRHHPAATAEEDTEGGPSGVILSYALWDRHFGRDPDVAQRTVVINGRDYVVTGVAPRKFGGIEVDPADAWILLTNSPQACSFSGRNLLHASQVGGRWLNTIGRLREGFGLEQASAELDSLRGEALLNYAEATTDNRATLRSIMSGTDAAPENRVAL